MPLVQSAYPLWDDPKLAERVAEGAYYLPGSVTGTRDTLVTSAVDARPQFVLRLPKSPATVVARLARRRILPGVPLRTYDRTLADSLLVAVTEQRTREEIDAYAGALAEVLK